MNSGDGATGVSSALGVAGGPFAGGAAERTVVGTTPLDEGADPMDDEGVNVGRPAEDAATMAAVAFPLGPTVVHAPPINGAAELALLVVSAYARRSVVAAADSLEAAFFRLSSSSKISRIDFLAPGF